jgi:hypothetical protein
MGQDTALVQESSVSLVEGSAVDNEITALNQLGTPEYIPNNTIKDEAANDCI